MKVKIKNPMCLKLHFHPYYRVSRGSVLFDPLKFWRISYREYTPQAERLTCSGFKVKLSRR